MNSRRGDDRQTNLDAPLTQINLLQALQRLRATLQEAGETRGEQLVSNILKLDPGSERFWQAVTSLEIWGGSGSLFDQAFMNVTGDLIPLERRYWSAMLELSDLIERERRSTHFVRSAASVIRQWNTKK